MNSLQARTEGEARGEVAEAAEAERGLAMDPRRNYNSRELNVVLYWIDSGFVVDYKWIVSGFILDMGFMKWISWDLASGR